MKYNVDRYNDIKIQILIYLLRIGYKEKNIQFVPITGYLGENLTEKAENLNWADGTLVDALDNLKAPKRPIDKPLRLPL